MTPENAQQRTREDFVRMALEAFLAAGGERNPARSMEAALTAVDFWGAAAKAAAHCGGAWQPSTHFGPGYCVNFENAKPATAEAIARWERR